MAEKHVWFNIFFFFVCLFHLRTSVTISISKEIFLNEFFPLQVTLSIRGVKYRVRKHRNVQVEWNVSDCSRLNIFLLPVLLTQTCSLSGMFWPLSWKMLPPLCLLKGIVGAPLVSFLFFPPGILICLELFESETFISAFQHILSPASWEKECSALWWWRQPRWASWASWAVAEQADRAEETCGLPEFQLWGFF